MVVSFGVFVAVTSVVAVLVAVVTILIFRARYARLKASADEPLTEIASRLISVLATAGLVVDESLAVLRATNSAIALGLVSGRVIRSPEIRALVRETQESETTNSVEFELTLSEGGDIRYLRARAAIIGAGIVLVLVEDNTEARDFESIRRDFIANVTHEIKTPIGAIALLSEAMEGALDDPTRMHKFADSLRRETRRLSTLITEIIQLSRVETSNILAKAKPANIGVVVREALERTVVIADAKDIVVNAKYPDDIFVMGDGELLTVAVKNLVENAIQYSDSKQSVGIGVTARNGHVDIIVTDQGVGIPAEEQSRVFERFYRVDESRDRTTGGTGLGLSLVKHIALSHRGEVTLFSQPGVGSTFTIRLPRLVDIAKENAHE
jgi:two-component system, OmpR family, sensor histidine kinase SenX3